MHTASIVYGDITNFYQQSIICEVSAPVERWCGAQNKELRATPAAVSWEIRQMSGELDLPLLETMKVIMHTTRYDDMGIESSWSSISAVALSSPRVLMSDDYSSLVWDMSFSLVVARRTRCLHLSDGYPRRFF
jgi:hypothetical protein